MVTKRITEYKKNQDKMKDYEIFLKNYRLKLIFLGLPTWIIYGKLCRRSIYPFNNMIEIEIGLLYYQKKRPVDYNRSQYFIKELYF